jgi:AIPR protein
MKNLSQAKPHFVEFPFHSFRNITCPEDTRNSRKVLSGRAPVKSILGLSTDANVRDYLVGAEGKKRRRPGDVHRAIEDTVLNQPDNFCVLNGGVVIVARGFDADEQRKVLLLDRPSIINGAQTQGTLIDVFDRLRLANGQIPDMHITYEIIVTQDEGLIAEVSIARNFQNDVMTISIVGRLKQLDELEVALKNKYPFAKLRKSETELSDDYVASEKLLQVLTALVPDSLWAKSDSSANKVYTYSQKTKCLKDFQEIYEKAKDPKDKDHLKFKELYQFFLDMAPDAWTLYQRWKTHQGFQGTGLRAIEREGRQVVDVPDGIIFPIIASLSAFASRSSNGWKITLPSQFKDEDLIQAAKTVYMEIADSNPQTMGKSKACYSSLLQLTTVYQKLS